MDRNRENLIDDLALLADGIFVEYEAPSYGLAAAGLALREKTSDETIVRAALLKSMYGAVESLNLRATFALF